LKKKQKITIPIADKIIGEDHPCFIIAEAGVNHDGDIQKAKQLIDIAKNTGADAVKFQTWITEDIVTQTADQAPYQIENTGKKESQYDMLKRLELAFTDFQQLKEYADTKGIIFLSTPDDEKSVDFLYNLGVPAFKIGSGELTNTVLLQKIAQKKRPIILSTGMATLEEVRNAVATIRDTGAQDLILLHCTSNYPATPDTVNLRAMKTLRDAFQVLTGYSDHTEGITISVAAVLLGACVLEKHFTYDKNAKGPDHKASLSPDELQTLVKKIRAIEQLSRKERDMELRTMDNLALILGSGEKKPVDSELNIKPLVRKSIVAVKNIKRGEVLTRASLSMKRPGTGLPASKLPNIIGRKAARDITKDELINFKMLE
jgi:sialic acid synthase SpsE